MKRAWRGVLEPLVASATTVVIGLLCLLFSELNSNKSTGPVAAIGIACALLATLTLLPALLVIPRVAVVPEAVLVVRACFRVVLHGAGGIALRRWCCSRCSSDRGGAAGAVDGPRWMPWLALAGGALGVLAAGAAVRRRRTRSSPGIWSRVAAFIGRRARLSGSLTTLVLLVAGPSPRR